MELIRARLTGSKFGGMAMLVMAYFLYTTGDVLVKLTGGRLPVFEMVFFVGLAFAGFSIAAAFLLKTPEALRPNRPWLLLARGVVNFVNYGCCYYSFTHMPIVNVYSVLFSAPMFLTVFSALFLGEQVQWRRWTAVIVGFVGILVMLRPGSMPFNFTTLVMLTTPITSSVGMLIVRYASRTESSLSIALINSLTVTAGAGLLMTQDFHTPSGTDLSRLIASGITAGLAFLLLISGFKLTSTPLGAPFQYTQLIWATLAGWLIWNQIPDQWMFLGAAIVIASGLFTLYREMHLVRRPRRLKPQAEMVAELVAEVPA